MDPKPGFYDMQVSHRQPVFVPYGPDDSDLALPSAYWISVEDERIPYSLQLIVRVREGRPTCEQLTCKEKPGRPPVTGEGIRRLPLATILRQSAAYAALRVHEVEPGHFELVPRDDLDDEADIYSAWRRSGDRRRNRIGEADLATVADIYRAAMANGHSPTKTVAQVLHLHRSTAGRWVMRARQGGFLPPTDERKARA